MKVKVVIFNHNQLVTAEKLYSSLSECFDTALLDSGSAQGQISPLTTHSFDNLYWTGCWNKSWQLFADYDVVWGIGGDCVLNAPAKDFRDAIASVPAFGIWSPAIDGESLTYMKVDESKILSVKFIEGVAFALSRKLWTKVGRFDSKNYLGWGHDAIHSHLSRRRGMLNIIDGRVQLHHPPSGQYDRQIARILMVATMKKMLGDDFAAFKRSLDESMLLTLNNTIEDLSARHASL